MSFLVESLQQFPIASKTITIPSISGVTIDQSAPDAASSLSSNGSILSWRLSHHASKLSISHLQCFAFVFPESVKVSVFVDEILYIIAQSATTLYRIVIPPDWFENAGLHCVESCVFGLKEVVSFHCMDVDSVVLNCRDGLVYIELFSHEGIC